ncbi:unnamed protein product [Symbiodinium pilosum]|uniref:PPM-type phosphatase domain-containing protein n=1 Tax=Symbiodinium pilosum TaxID=2952 RepID=A0A812X5N1_SYMPI|nr:unnamed protein product [Symbiodinium pilosum]
MEVAPDVLHVVGADFEQRLKEFRIQSASGLGCSLSPPMTSPFPRALGDRELKIPNKVVLAEPEVRTVWLERTHVALALYCDGIAEHVPPEDLAERLRKGRGSEKSVAAELTQEAYNQGSEQNLTAITVYFRWPTKRSHDQVNPTPAQPPAKRPANGDSTPGLQDPAPKKAPQAAKRPVLTAEDVRKEKACRRTNRGHERVPSPTPATLIEEQRPGDQAEHELQILRVSGALFQDGDGDVAHEFLGESNGGLEVLKAVKV